MATFYERMLAGMTSGLSTSATMQGGSPIPNNNGRGGIRYGSHAAVTLAMNGINSYFVNNVKSIVPWAWAAAINGHSEANSAVEIRRMSAQVMNANDQWEWLFKDSTPDYGIKKILDDGETQQSGQHTLLPGGIVRLYPSGNNTFEYWPGDTPNVPYPSIAYLGARNRGLMEQAKALCVFVQCRKVLTGAGNIDNAHYALQLGTDPQTGDGAQRYIHIPGGALSNNPPALGDYPYGAYDGDFSRWEEITSEWEWYGFVTANNIPGWEIRQVGPGWSNYSYTPAWFQTPYQITYDHLQAHPPMDPDGGVVTTDRTVVIFGDSIVAGDEPSYYSFRGPLYDSLVASGYNVDFTGPLSWASLGSPETDHAGYGGATIGPDSSGNNLYSRIGTVIDGTNDVIVIEAGTNNLTGNGNGYANIATEYTTFVNAVIAANPTAKILLLTPYPTTYYSADQLAGRNNLYNATLSLQSTYPNKIWVYDLGTAMTATDYYVADGTHPSEIGAEALASGILPVLKTLLNGNIQTPTTPVDAGERLGVNLTVIDADYKLGAINENFYSAGSGGEVSSEITSIDLGLDTLTLGILGITYQLEPIITVTGTPDESVTYSTSNAAVATVSASGLVTSITSGTATITVRSVADPTKTDSLTVFSGTIFLDPPVITDADTTFDPLTITGTGLAGATVEVFVDSLFNTSVVVDEFSQWTTSFSLEAGTYAVTARQVFNGTYSAQTISTEVVVDSEDPAPTDTIVKRIIIRYV